MNLYKQFNPDTKSDTLDAIHMTAAIGAIVLYYAANLAINGIKGEVAYQLDRILKPSK